MTTLWFHCCKVFWLRCGFTDVKFFGCAVVSLMQSLLDALWFHYCKVYWLRCGFAAAKFIGCVVVSLLQSFFDYSVVSLMQSLLVGLWFHYCKIFCYKFVQVSALWLRLGYLVITSCSLGCLLGLGLNIIGSKLFYNKVVLIIFYRIN